MFNSHVATLHSCVGQEENTTDKGNSECSPSLIVQAVFLPNKGVCIQRGDADMFRDPQDNRCRYSTISMGIKHLQRHDREPKKKKKFKIPIRNMQFK